MAKNNSILAQFAAQATKRIVKVAGIVPTETDKTFAQEVRENPTALLGMEVPFSLFRENGVNYAAVNSLLKSDSLQFRAPKGSKDAEKNPTTLYLRRIASK